MNLVWRTRSFSFPALLLFLVWALSVSSALSGTSNSMDQPERTVVVLPFKNLTPESEYDFLSDGLQHVLSSYLVRSPAFLVLERSPLDGLTSVQALRSIAGDNTDALLTLPRSLLGADLVLFGTLTTQDSLLVLNAKLIDTETGKIEASASVQGPVSSAIPLSEALAKKLLAEYSPADSGAVPRIEFDLSNEYLRDYVLAMGKLRDSLERSLSLPEAEDPVWNDILETTARFDSLRDSFDARIRTLEGDMEIVDLVTREKDGKLFAASKMVNRIDDFEKRLGDQATFFLWVMGIVVTILTLLAGWVVSRIHKLDKKLERAMTKGRSKVASSTDSGSVE